MEVSIADTGQALMMKRNKLFNKYMQLHGAQDKRGTGLGLVVSKGIVEALWRSDLGF